MIVEFLRTTFFSSLLLSFLAMQRFLHSYFNSPNRFRLGDGSNVKFSMTDQYYALIGTAPKPIDNGVKVNTSSFIKVQLSSPHKKGLNFL